MIGIPSAPPLVNNADEQDGTHLKVNFHAGQARAWLSEARFVAVLAGTQGGKTSFGPHWLYREIQRRGPGDYMVVTPTFPLLDLKALPEFLRLFDDTLHAGKYVGSPSRKFKFSAAGSADIFHQHVDEPTTVYFGYAADPESLEAATAKAAWLDEAGQKRFKLGSWEAINRRLAVHQGRVLLTTTIYNLGWLKQKIWDPWRAGDNSIEVIRFNSTQNPAFPPEEFERARRELPAWKFDMFYRAVFSRPAGLIYDCFNEAVHIRDGRFHVPRDWTRYLGLDFGGVNTAATFFAEDPGNGRLYAYREYLEGGRTAAEHVEALLKGELGIPMCVGGSKSEDQWRAEFSAAGLPVMAPTITEVEVGIDRVYGVIKKNELCVLDHLSGLREELSTYSRELDDRGDPTEKIEDKESFHLLDSARYILGWWATNRGPQECWLPPVGQRSIIEKAPDGVFRSNTIDDETKGVGGARRLGIPSEGFPQF